MKTLLIATDFSEHSNQVALYGYNLAIQLKTDVLLCNAMTILAEIPQAGFVGFPNEGYETMMEDSAEQLDKLRKFLQSTNSDEHSQPRIRCISESGIVGDVVSQAAEDHRVSIIIAGTHSSNGLTEFIMGDHTRSLIDRAEEPLLIVPSGSKFKTVKRIALALDFADLKQDLATLLRTISIAKIVDAEILLTHIDINKKPDLEIREYLEQTLTGLAKKSGYCKIKTLVIEDKKVEQGLSWLCQHGNIEMLAMAHHTQGLFTALFKSSHTKKMSANLCAPMLVLPCK